MKVLSYDKVKFEKNRQEYAEKCLERAYQYEEDIKSGKIIAGKLIKQAIDRRQKIHKKYFFKKDAVLDVFRFFYLINITVDNKLSRYEPFAWHCWITMNVFGYYRSENSNKRVFRYANIWVSRKSSKTTYAAILSLYSFTKLERNAEAYFCATTKKQASQALKYLKRIIKDSPLLKKKITRRRYHLEYEGNGTCTAEPVANEPDTLDGLSPSFVIVDEKHAFPDNEMFNIMKTGTLARENPLIVTISTSGLNKSYPFFSETEMGKKVLSGAVEDDSTFYAFYQLDDESEVEDPRMWIKSNPSLRDENGVGVIHLDDMIYDYKKACLSIADRINFLVKNLNLYQDGDQNWIPDDAYKRCRGEVNLSELVGGRVYLGLDLSKTRDLSSLVAVIEHPETKKLHVVPEFYFPTSDNEENKIRAGGIDLTEWIEKDYIQPHEGRTIDDDEIFNRIEWWVNNFDVVSLGYDQYAAVKLMEKVKSELMLDVTPCKQNTTFYNFPMKYAEKLIFDEEINMGDNPVLRWNFMNVVIYIDGNGNTKCMKNKSLDSIDGTVAFLMGLAMYAEDNFDALGSIYGDINDTLDSNNNN